MGVGQAVRRKNEEGERRRKKAEEECETPTPPSVRTATSDVIVRQHRLS